MKKKFICAVCGYIYEGESAPEKCPICKAPASKFSELKDEGEMTYATVHKIGDSAYGIQRLIWRNVLPLKPVHAKTNSVLPRMPRLPVSMLFMTPFMRWLRMRHVMVQALPVF